MMQKFGGRGKRAKEQNKKMAGEKLNKTRRKRERRQRRGVAAGHRNSSRSGDGSGGIASRKLTLEPWLIAVTILRA